ncbi:hypothetical protein [Streptomyces sp. NPDC001070]
MGGARVLELSGEVSGEVDAVTAPSLTARPGALTGGPRPHVIVGLRDVTFMDCSGNGRLSIVTGDGWMPRLPRPADLADVLDLHDDLAGALALPRDAASSRVPHKARS